MPRLGSAVDTTLLAGHPSSSAPAPTNGGEPEDPSKYAFYNIKRYRTYFNVDTKVGEGQEGQRKKSRGKQRGCQRWQPGAPGLLCCLLHAWGGGTGERLLSAE